LGSFRVALAEEEGAVENSWGKAGSGGVGYVGWAQCIEKEMADIYAAKFLGVEVGSQGKVHEKAVPDTLTRVDLVIRKFERSVDGC
jgi:hypothetical protein